MSPIRVVSASMWRVWDPSANADKKTTIKEDTVKPRLQTIT